MKMTYNDKSVNLLKIRNIIYTKELFTYLRWITNRFILILDQFFFH